MSLHGVCDCGLEIDGAEGVSVDSDGNRWHPWCRRAELDRRRAAKAAAAQPDKGASGRRQPNPKTPEAPTAA
jgi:hypothetical protein